MQTLECNKMPWGIRVRLWMIPKLFALICLSQGRWRGAWRALRGKAEWVENEGDLSASTQQSTP